MESESESLSMDGFKSVECAPELRVCGCWSTGDSTVCECCAIDPNGWMEQIKTVPMAPLPDIIPTMSATTPADLANLTFFADVATTSTTCTREEIAERFSIFDIDVDMPAAPVATPVADTHTLWPQLPSTPIMTDLEIRQPESAIANVSDEPELMTNALHADPGPETPSLVTPGWRQMSTCGRGRGYLDRLLREESRERRRLGLPSYAEEAADSNSEFSFERRNLFTGPNDRPWVRTEEQNWHHEGLMALHSCVQRTSPRPTVIHTHHPTYSVCSDSTDDSNYEDASESESESEPKSTGESSEKSDPDEETPSTGTPNYSTYSASPGPYQWSRDSPESPEPEPDSRFNTRSIAPPTPPRGNFARRGRSMVGRPALVDRAGNSTASTIVTTNDDVVPEVEITEVSTTDDDSDTEDDTGSITTENSDASSTPRRRAHAVDPEVEPMAENGPTRPLELPEEFNLEFYTLQYLQSRVRTIIVPGANQAYWNQLQRNLTATAGGFLAPMQFIKGSLTYNSGVQAHLCAPLHPEGGVELYFRNPPPHNQDDSDAMATRPELMSHTYMMMDEFPNEELAWAPVQRAREPYAFRTPPVYPAPPQMIRQRDRRRRQALRRMQTRPTSRDGEASNERTARRRPY